ncbi:CRISPR-associated protein Cas1 [Ignicoccus pacificus DSM 13166]|uniref:CRISPR-associated endonuclease Cas1 n=1 Tax=Ignicoccus pacificus DSM 13166 TaxID=940294 RepID=A0A977PK85_9CREN|nr:CRISPR-associated protein Cas1 [Ignicoccus pacificus DSM 13166]
MRTFFVTDPGRIARKDGGVAYISKDGEVKYLTNDYDVIVVASSKVSITSAAMRLLARYGIDLVVLEWNGEPVIRASSPIPNKTAMTRLKQYEVILKGKALDYAKPIIMRKIIEQGRTLRYIAKSKRINWLRDQSYQLEKLAQDASSAQDPDSLRSVEALAAKLYWGLLSEVFEDFPGRIQESQDPYNMAINYAYGILYSNTAKALTVVGLDIYADFFHTPKSGKSSLVYDFSEQFKPLVDQALFSKLNFERLQAVNGALTYDSRKEVAKVVTEALEECISNLLLVEAWNLTSYLKEERVYVPGWKRCM